MTDRFLRTQKFSSVYCVPCQISFVDKTFYFLKLQMHSLSPQHVSCFLYASLSKIICRLALLQRRQVKQLNVKKRRRSREGDKVQMLRK